MADSDTSIAGRSCSSSVCQRTLLVLEIAIFRNDAGWQSHRRYQMSIVEMAEAKLNRTRRLNPSHKEKVTSGRKWYLEDQLAKNLRGQAGIKWGSIDPASISSLSKQLPYLNHNWGGYQKCYSQMALMLQQHISSTSLQSDGSHTSSPNDFTPVIWPSSCTFEIG